MGLTDGIGSSSQQKPCVAHGSGALFWQASSSCDPLVVRLCVSPGSRSRDQQPPFFSHRRKEEPCVIRFSSEQPRRCSSWPSFSVALSGLFLWLTQPPPLSPVVPLGRACTLPSITLHQGTPSSSSSVGVRVRLTFREQAEEHLLSRRI